MFKKEFADLHTAMGRCFMQRSPSIVVFSVKFRFLVDQELTDVEVTIKSSCMEGYPTMLVLFPDICSVFNQSLENIKCPCNAALITGNDPFVLRGSTSAPPSMSSLTTLSCPPIHALTLFYTRFRAGRGVPLAGKGRRLGWAGAGPDPAQRSPGAEAEIGFFHQCLTWSRSSRLEKLGSKN